MSTVPSLYVSAQQDIGPPEKIIKGFAPELYKDPLEEEDIMEQYVEQHDGLDYYYWCVLS